MSRDTVHQELVMTFELPKVASASAIDLDITEHGLELTVSRASESHERVASPAVLTRFAGAWPLLS